jgi:hypothetical protein
VIEADAGSRGRTGLWTVVALGCALFAASIGVRAIAPARATLPKDRVEERPHIAEPMQLLSRGAQLRAAELDRWVSEPQRPGFRAARQTVFALSACPPLVEWIDGAEGQPVERLIASLRAGSREDALASLTLVFRIARACEWAPGIVARRADHAERLGGLLQDWLRVWGEKSAKDPLLADPALAAAVLYGRAMRTAFKAPLLSNNRAPHERAVAFLGELTGISSGRRTDFGEALRARYARAAEKLAGGSDPLIGLEEEAASLFPDLDGSCP